MNGEVIGIDSAATTRCGVGLTKTAGAGSPVNASLGHQAYQVMKDHDLWQKRKVRTPELYQSAKLFELLPQKPNDLWQMDSHPRFGFSLTWGRLGSVSELPFEVRRLASAQWLQATESEVSSSPE